MCNTLRCLEQCKCLAMGRFKLSLNSGHKRRYCASCRVLHSGSFQTFHLLTVYLICYQHLPWFTHPLHCEFSCKNFATRSSQFSFCSNTIRRNATCTLQTESETPSSRHIIILADTPKTRVNCTTLCLRWKSWMMELCSSYRTR